MLKIPRRISEILSLVVAGVFFAGLVFGAAIVPSIMEKLFTSANVFVGDISEAGKLVLTVSAFLTLFIAAVADVLLILLILRVRAGKVFTPAAVALIRAVSWCCMAICAVFIVMSKWLIFLLVVAIAALLLGLALRVVKNAVEEAVVLKNENDLTV